MAVMIEPSLFEATGATPLANSLAWIDATLFGSVALALCVLAVALVGMLSLTGRLPIRRGFHVVLGCFVLLGAPVIATGLLSGVNAVAKPTHPVAPPPSSPEIPREELPPSDHDPYAGA